jgi:hypothetical protein
MQQMFCLPESQREYRSNEGSGHLLVKPENLQSTTQRDEMALLATGRTISRYRTKEINGWIP